MDVPSQSLRARHFLMPSQERPGCILGLSLVEPGDESLVEYLVQRQAIKTQPISQLGQSSEGSVYQLFQESI